MPRKPYIEEGDRVILRGKVTRLSEPNALGVVQITVRLDGVEVPVTLGEDLVEREKG